MEYPLRETVFMGLAVIAAAILLYISLPMAVMAREANSGYITAKAESAAIIDEREWLKYTGTVSGAAMLGFITRNKDSCDIVIRNHTWDTRIETFLFNGELILGTSAAIPIPDYFWNTAFLFDVLLGGRGERVYIASLIYNYDTVVGISYMEV